MATLTSAAPTPSTQESSSILPTASYEAHTMPSFNPSIHLAFSPPSARHSFTSLNLPKPTTAPDMCFTEPFQLFSDEGIKIIRLDLLRNEVLDKHLQVWERAPCYIGGAEVTATWIRDMWYHPAVIDCISQAFGLPVKPLGRLGEVGYTNIQLGPDGVQGVYKLSSTPSPALPAIPAPSLLPSGPMTDSWHRDSTQLVVVVMLSNTSTMHGGETAIKPGNGDILLVRGGKAGSAVVMQGGHAALRASNATERISMVTSYSFVDARLDDSGTSLRSISTQHHDMRKIQEHFLLHKLYKLRERIDLAISDIQNRSPESGDLKREEVEPWVEEQITFLKQTGWELFERYPKFLYKDVPEGTLKSYLCHI